MKTLSRIASLFFLPCSILGAGNLYVCGDSIAADYSRRDPRPAWGWGEFLQEKCPKNVTVRDLAIPGSSTKTWFDTGKWENLCAQLEPNDFVFIALGFNDSDEKNPAAFSDAEKFGKNLEKMIGDVRRKGATPLLVTPTVVHKEDENLSARHRKYRDAILQAGEKTHCETIDLNRLFRERLAAADDPGKFYVLQRTVPVPNWLDFDPVHLSEKGAKMAAESVVEIVRKENLSAQTLFR